MRLKLQEGLPAGAGKKHPLMSAQTTKLQRILWLAESRAHLDLMLGQINAAGLDVALVFTSDYAVAACASNDFAAVLLDAALIRNDDWSVAKSLKLIKPSVPILLVDSRNVSRKDTLPPNIDALAKLDDPKDVLLKLKGLLAQESQRSREFT